MFQICPCFHPCMSDDFFGLMDAGEGQMLGGFDECIAYLDMLVSNLTQAKEMVDKVVIS